MNRIEQIVSARNHAVSILPRLSLECHDCQYILKNKKLTWRRLSNKESVSRCQAKWPWISGEISSQTVDKSDKYYSVCPRNSSISSRVCLFAKNFFFFRRSHLLFFLVCLFYQDQCLHSADQRGEAEKGTHTTSNWQDRFKYLSQQNTHKSRLLLLPPSHLTKRNSITI